MLVAVAGILGLTLAGIALGRSDDAGALVWFNSFHVGAVGAVTDATYNLLEPVPSVLITVLTTALLW